MKIKFLQIYTDPNNPSKTFQPGWVAEFSDPDAKVAIDGGFAESVSDGIYSRRYANTAELSTECVPTGTSITLAELTGEPEPEKPKGFKKNLVFGKD